MTIHTTPASRTEMAHAISERLGVPAVYMRTPTYAFQIGNVTVNRDGSTSCDDQSILAALKPMLIENGYLTYDTIEDAPSGKNAERTAPVTEDSSVSESIQESETTPAVAPGLPDAEQIQEPNELHLHLPTEGITVAHLRNLMNMLYSMQNLLNKAMAVLRADDAMCGVNLKDGQLVFELPFDTQASDRWAQYTLLFNQIIDACKRATRVRAQVKPLGDNEKYLMHSWLIRIGCGGPDFKPLRKLLTANLTGYCAFPDQARADRHKSKYAELRRIHRDVNKEAHAR